jgi:DNA-binding LytR/AlgR family response regulator
MNCIIIDDDAVQNALIEEYLKEIDGINCVGVFNNPIDFLKAQNGLKLDFIILDMEMPKMSGVDLLNSFEKSVSVLVISSKPKYAIQVINLDVLGYLLKPVKFVDFMKMMGKIKTKLNSFTPIPSEEKNHLFIKSDGMLHKLKYADITHISAAVDYIEVHTFKKKYLVNSSMNKVNLKLPKNSFFRIHRSTIINVNHINRIDKELVEVGLETVRIAPSKREPFLEFINSL